MSNYFESYSFEVPTTDPNTRKTKYTFAGDKDYINSIKQKPVEITSVENVSGWLVQSKGYSSGVLKITAEKMLGIRTIKIESIQSNKLPKFKTIELESDYNVFNPIGDVNANYVEIHDKQGKTDAGFTKIDQEAEQPYERKFGNSSSIASITDFLRDPEFEKMLKSVKLEDE